MSRRHRHAAKQVKPATAALREQAAARLAQQAPAPLAIKPEPKPASTPIQKRSPVIEDQVVAARRPGAKAAIPSRLEFRKRVASLCTAKGISQGKLGQSIGRSKSYISLIWLGEVNPSPDLIDKMSNVLGEDLRPYWQAPMKQAAEDAPKAPEAAPEPSQAVSTPTPVIEQAKEAVEPALALPEEATEPQPPVVIDPPKSDVEAIIRKESRPSNIKTERMTIDPKTARIFLMANRGNRTLSENHVLWLARQITQGHWDAENGETIKFDPSGELIDGQHRLQAVVFSDIAIEVDVAFGVPKKSQATIDTNRSRSIGDQLHINGEKYGSNLSAAVRWVFAISSGQTIYKTNTLEVQQFLKDHPEIRDSTALVKGRHAKGAIPTLLIALHFIASKALGETEKADQFIEVFITGEPNYSGDPAFRAREIYRDAREKGQSIAQNRQLHNLIHAWNLFRKGVSVKSIRLPSEIRIEGYDPKSLGITAPARVAARSVRLADGTKVLEQA